MFFGAYGILALLATIFWVWMLIDCATHERNSTDKLIWILIILFTHVLGALIYFLVRRKGRVRV